MFAYSDFFSSSVSTFGLAACSLDFFSSSAFKLEGDFEGGALFFSSTALTAFAETEGLFASLAAVRASLSAVTVSGLFETTEDLATSGALGLF